MRTTCIFLSTALLCSPAFAKTISPDDLAQEFYSWVLSQSGAGSGLPDANERAQLAKFFSSHLLQVIDSAIIMEKQCIENNTPGDKPHVIEGNMLVNNYEGATEVIVGQAIIQGKDMVVASQLFSIDLRFPKAHRYRVHTWTDQLIISRDGDRWVISNIQFESGASLASFLTEYLTNGARWCNAGH